MARTKMNDGQLAAQIQQQYEKALFYNASIQLNDTVRENEDFFLGKQWEGVNAPDLDKPVFNILKRVVNYFIAMLVSDNIGIKLSLFNRVEDSTTKIYLETCERQIRQIMEYNKFGVLSRNVLRDAAVDGDGCIHVYFDPAAPTGWDGVTGLARMEQIDNTSVFFGNPQVADVQKQPYIIIETRRMIKAVKREMKEAGRPQEDIDSITTDTSLNDILPDNIVDDDKVTVLTKYWKGSDGKVRWARAACGVLMQPETETDMDMYPVTYMSWERVKNSYHGRSVVSGLLPNQMAINKMGAMAQRFIRNQAFPRVIYNKQKLERWEEGTRPIGVEGPPTDIVASDPHSRDMSAQVAQYMDSFIGYTKDLMGASDAALGNVNPQNTSAIISVQRATAIPLELVRQSYYQFVEDLVRIIIDMMKAFYGRRMVVAKDENGDEQEIELDFGRLADYVLDTNVDIGQAAYWSEMTAVTNLDALYTKGLIEPLDYLEAIPDSSLPNKGQIIARLKEKMEEAQQAAEAAGGQAPAEMPEDIMAADVLGQMAPQEGGVPIEMPEM